MSAQGLEVIDHTVHLTHEWINDLTARLGWYSSRSALRLLRVTLQHLRDHLSPDELAQLSAQLPLLIRGMFFEGWVPKKTPIKERRAQAFAGFIASQMEDTDEYRGAEDIACVFALLNDRLSAGEIHDVRVSLSEDVRSLWPAP